MRGAKLGKYILGLIKDLAAGTRGAWEIRGWCDVFLRVVFTRCIISYYGNVVRSHYCVNNPGPHHRRSGARQARPEARSEPGRGSRPPSQASDARPRPPASTTAWCRPRPASLFIVRPVIVIPVTLPRCDFWLGLASDVPDVSLLLGASLNKSNIRENSDVYFECL